MAGFLLPVVLVLNCLIPVTPQIMPGYSAEDGPPFGNVSPGQGQMGRPDQTIRRPGQMGRPDQTMGPPDQTFRRPGQLGRRDQTMGRPDQTFRRHGQMGRPDQTMGRPDQSIRQTGQKGRPDQTVGPADKTGQQGETPEYLAEDGPPFGNVPTIQGRRQMVTRQPNTQTSIRRAQADRGGQGRGPSTDEADGRRRGAPRRINGGTERRPAFSRGNNRGGENFEGRRREVFGSGPRPAPPNTFEYPPGLGYYTHSYQNPADVVAFSGTAKSSQHFYRDSAVIFDNFITNIGGGYNYKHGIFTAPVSGIYLFNYHAMSLPDGVRPATLDLVRNHHVVNSATGIGRSGSPSNTAILFLNRYDRVSVMGRGGSAIFCQTGNAFCSFNVALLRMGVFADYKIARNFPVPGHVYQ